GSRRGFLSSGTMGIIEESRRARLGGRAGLYRELKRATVRAVRNYKEAYVRGICETVKGHLWSSDSRPENQMVHNLVPSGGVAWIGLYRDEWKWSDGSDSSFRNWKPDQPLGSTKSCVAADFSADGQWENLKSNVKSAFICYSGEHIA
uniref:C-type lectin domain-containing protein n=1 Tax=Cyclopterus lumpus TaxID=8103 RepID=A0A8C2X3Z0_CYCLU